MRRNVMRTVSPAANWSGLTSTARVTLRKRRVVAESSGNIIRCAEAEWGLAKTAMTSRAPTASAFIVDAAGGLLGPITHKVLNRSIQPGNHGQHPIYFEASPIAGPHDCRWADSNGLSQILPRQPPRLALEVESGVERSGIESFHPRRGPENPMGTPSGARTIATSERFAVSWDLRIGFLAKGGD